MIELTDESQVRTITFIEGPAGYDMLGFIWRPSSVAPWQLDWRFRKPGDGKNWYQVVGQNGSEEEGQRLEETFRDVMLCSDQFLGWGKPDYIEVHGSGIEAWEKMSDRPWCNYSYESL